MADTVTFPITRDTPTGESVPATAEAFIFNIDETTNIPNTLNPLVTIADQTTRVKDACIGDDCRYVAKYIWAEPIPYYYKEDEEWRCPTMHQIARNEINITQRASDLGIGPKVHYTALMDTQGVIIMDKYDGTLADIIYRYQTDHTIPIEEILRNIYKLMTIMIRNGIRHRDLHSSNIFYKNDGTYVIGDYGISVISNSEKLAREDWHSYYDIVRTVREIKNGRRFNDTNEIMFNLTDDDDHLLYLSWKGNICPTW